VGGKKKLDWCEKGLPLNKQLLLEKRGEGGKKKEKSFAGSSKKKREGDPLEKGPAYTLFISNKRLRERGGAPYPKEQGGF